MSLRNMSIQARSVISEETLGIALHLSLSLQFSELLNTDLTVSTFSLIDFALDVSISVGYQAGCSGANRRVTIYSFQ